MRAAGFAGACAFRLGDRFADLLGWLDGARSRARNDPQRERGPDRPAAGGDGDRAARRRRATRGPARAAHAEGASSWAAPGCSPAAPSTPTRARATRPTARRRSARSPRRPASRCPTRRRWCRSRAGSRRPRCRSASTPTSSSPSRRTTPRSSSTGQEIVDARWFEPARALEGSEAGEILMVFPTIKNLERIARVRHRRRAARVGGDARGQARRAARRGPGRGRAHRHRR